MSDPAWSRPSLPRRRWLLRRIAWMLAIAVLATYAVWLLARPRTVFVSLPTPVAVTVPAPVVNVTSPPPVVNVTSPPPPAPEPGPVVAPHGLTPKLDVACVVPTEGAVVPSEEGADMAPVDPACAWDSGFPAVSADGKRVAVRRVQIQSGTGYLVEDAILILHVTTSRIVRRDLLVDPADYGADGKLHAANMRSRVARIQDRLDRGGFRAMTRLGSSSSPQEVPDEAPVHVEFADDAVRIVDHTAMLWRDRLRIPAPRSPDPERDCSGWNLHGTTLWWDPSIKVVVASQIYSTGSCLCDNVEEFFVRRIP